MSLTEMVIMPGVDYQNTCDAIREKTGGTETIKSGQMADAVGDVFLAGEQENEDKWAKRFYCTTVRGNGQRDISVELPFEPDYVSLGGYEEYSSNKTYCMWEINRDFKTFAYRAGRIIRTEANTTAINTAIGNNTVEQYIGFSNGKLIFTCPSVVVSGVVWRPESNYRLVAYKYTEDGKTDEDLLKDYVLSLPDSGGTVTISSRRFTETGMTEDAFNAFTAENKPNWTFVIS